MRIVNTVLALLLGLTAATPVHSQDTDLERGRTYTRMFFAGETSAIWRVMTGEMQSALGSEAALKAFRDQIQAEAGTETLVVDERIDTALGVRTYLRRSRFDNAAPTLLVSWTFGENDLIAGFFVRPQPQAAASSYLDYETQAQLQLPFTGEWYVFWGGRDVHDNYHVVASDQRFAYDFVVVDGDRSHTGDGSVNDQYYCWGQTIVAPAKGLILSAVDGLPDNSPGQMDADNPPGNHVVLDLGNEEYALLAHLQQGSVSVGEGDRINAGDPIGLCGNSGNSSEPHLHFHIQDQPEFGVGEGKPAFFTNYLSNGKAVKRGEPIRGELVQRAVDASL